MHRMLLVLLLALVALTSAEAPSFCKCTCFTNSTIIPLSGQHSSSLSRAPQGGAGCSQCNRAFCLSYNLPICKDAEEKDVLTTCFQRDSRKDQIIVILFITATLGLLCWATVKSVLEKRKLRSARDLGLGVSYNPVQNNEH